MLTSGNGRHRRPRQAPAAVVTVAATGAGIALPLLAAGAAHATENSTWDKVAVCETGGRWSSDTGNGFYGGLAITQDTWDAYGGDVYAQRPDLASRLQQIAVAERILADIGPDAWPGCETGTGLLDDIAPPSADPGDTATPTAPAWSAPLPSARSYTPPAVPNAPSYTPPTTVPGVPSATPTTSPEATPTTPATPASPSATSGVTTTAPPTPSTTAPATPSADAPGAVTTPVPPTAPVASGAAKHAKPYSPTDEDLAVADRSTRTEVYSVTEKDTTQSDSTTNAAKSVNPANPADSGTANNSGKSGASPSNTSGSYTVDSGDSLSGIAAEHHVDGGWQRLYDVNHRLIGDDPNLIKPGQILNLG
jgi:LysM repeat protein